MSSINKIKLPDNIEYDINDVRIPENQTPATIFGPISNGNLVEWNSEHQALIDSDIDITNYINPAVPGVKIGAWTDEMLAGMVDLSSQKLLFDTSITTSARLSTTVFSTTGGYQLTGIISQQSVQQYAIMSALTNPDGSTTTIGGVIIIAITGAIVQRLWNTDVVVQRADGLYEFTLPTDFGTIIPESVTVTATDLQSFSYITQNMSELIGDALLLNNILISAPAADGTIATQEWVNEQDFGGDSVDTSNFVTLDGAETITGSKTFTNELNIADSASASTISFNPESPLSGDASITLESDTAYRVINVNGGYNYYQGNSSGQWTWPNTGEHTDLLRKQDITEATSTSAGLMSAADKSKVDSLNTTYMDLGSAQAVMGNKTFAGKATFVNEVDFTNATISGLPTFSFDETTGTLTIVSNSNS